MQDADHVDDVPFPCPIYDEMTTPATMAGNVYRPDSAPQIVTRKTSENVRAGVEFGNGGKDCRLVDSLLTWAESVAGEGEDTDEIFLRL